MKITGQHLQKIHSYLTKTVPLNSAPFVSSEKTVKSTMTANILLSQQRYLGVSQSQLRRYSTLMPKQKIDTHIVIRSIEDIKTKLPADIASFKQSLPVFLPEDRSIVASPLDKNGCLTLSSTRKYNDWMKTMLISLEKAKTEHELLKSALETAGFKAVYAIPGTKGLPDQVYCANTFFRVGNTLYYGTMKIPERREEVNQVINWFKDHPVYQGLEFVEIPSDYYFEGKGDGFVTQSMIIASHNADQPDSNRSDPRAFEFISEHSGLPLILLKRHNIGKDSPRVYHSDLVMVPFGEHILMDPRHFQPDTKEILEALGLSVLAFQSRETLENFAINSVRGPNGKAIVPHDAHDMMQLLEKHGIDYIPLQLDALRVGGGGIYCLSHSIAHFFPARPHFSQQALEGLSLQSIPFKEDPNGVILVDPGNAFNVSFVINKYMEGNYGQVDSKKAELAWRTIQASLKELNLFVLVYGSTPLKQISYPDRVFSRDPILPFKDKEGGKFLALNLKEGSRKGETKDISSFLEKNGLKVISWPSPEVYCEGGDIVKLPKKNAVFVGCGSGEYARTRKEALPIITRITGYTTIELTLIEDAYHLDTALFIRGDKALINPKGLDENSIQRVKDLGFQVHLLSEEESRNFASNSLNVGDMVLCNTGCYSKETKLFLFGSLEEAEKRLIEHDVREFNKAGGGHRCMTVGAYF